MPEFKTPSVTIEQLRKRYDSLNNAKITAEAHYKTAKTDLDELKATAKADYGTDDLESLRAKLKEMEAENDRKLAEYQRHLDTIDAELKEVNQKFNQREEPK